MCGQTLGNEIFRLNGAYNNKGIYSNKSIYVLCGFITLITFILITFFLRDVIKDKTFLKRRERSGSQNDKQRFKLVVKQGLLLTIQ